MKFKQIISFLMILVLIEFGLLFWDRSPQVTLKPQSLQILADKVIADCKASTLHQSCYDEEVPKLMDAPTNLSMESAFAVTDLILKQDSTYAHCHVLGHKLSGIETKKNPENWKDILTRCPTAVCNNGCLHGALMERYKTESLNLEQIEQVQGELTDVCEPRGDWHPTEVEIGMCYHALGHLNMYLTNADLKKSTEMCKLVGQKADGRDYYQACVEGVFMQVFQWIDPEDKALVAHLTPSKDGVDKFCAPFEGTAWEACHRESWALYQTELLKPEELTKFCSYSPTIEGQTSCYSSLMNFITVHFFVENSDLLSLKSYCLGLKSDFQGLCFAEAARRMLQLDPRYIAEALSICNSPEDPDLKNFCLERVSFYGKLAFKPKSIEFEAFCDRLPVPFKEKCLKNAV